MNIVLTVVTAVILVLMALIEMVIFFALIDTRKRLEIAEGILQVNCMSMKAIVARLDELESGIGPNTITYSTTNID